MMKRVVKKKKKKMIKEKKIPIPFDLYYRNTRFSRKEVR